jgi:hypothetical protein
VQIFSVIEPLVSMDISDSLEFEEMHLHPERLNSPTKGSRAHYSQMADDCVDSVAGVADLHTELLRSFSSG